jgi:hypothetical protein
MTLSIMMFRMTTLSIMTVMHNDTQKENSHRKSKICSADWLIMLSIIMLSVGILSITIIIVEAKYAMQFSLLC